MITLGQVSFLTRDLDSVSASLTGAGAGIWMAGGWRGGVLGGKGAPGWVAMASDCLDLTGLWMGRRLSQADLVLPAPVPPAFKGPVVSCKPPPESPL